VNLYCDIDYDGVTLGYEEAIRLSDGNVQCCETGITIPDGLPYAHCRLAWADSQSEVTEDDDGAYIVLPEHWHVFPQALEVWRFVRSSRRNHGSCFAFAGVTEEISANGTHDRDWAIFSAKWYSLCRVSRERYAAGKGPRLLQFERESLAIPDFVPWVPMRDGHHPNGDWVTSDRDLRFSAPGGTPN